MAKSRRHAAKLARRRLAAAPPPPPPPQAAPPAPAPASAPAPAAAPPTFVLPLRSHLTRAPRPLRHTQTESQADNESEAAKETEPDTDDVSRSDSQSEPESEGPVFSTLQSGFENDIIYHGTAYSGNKANKVKQLIHFENKWSQSVSQILDEDLAPKTSDGQVKDEVKWSLKLLSHLVELSAVWLGGPVQLNEMLREKVSSK